MSEKYTVHEFAESAGVSLDNDSARLLSACLCLVSVRQGLSVCTKRYKSSKPNPRYQQELEARQRGQGVALRKKIGQSYFVKAFDASLEYYFKQLCILLIDVP